MPHNNSTFHQITKLIDWSLFSKYVDQHKGDYRVRHLRMKDQFLSLLYAQLSGSKSLREIEAGLQSHQAKLYHAGLRSVKKSTLADANSKRPSAVYLQFFTHFLNTMTSGTRRHMKDVTRLIDATRIALPASTNSWARASKNKTALKLQIVFDPDQALPLEAEMTSTLVNDICFAKSLKLEPGATYVFDLGYYSFDWWAKMDDLGCRFVSRLKRNATPEIIKHLPVPEGSNVLSDTICQLKPTAGKRGRNPLCKPIRVLKVRIETGKVIRVVSNDLDSPAVEIAALYKQRWDIELFFKWIKQNLKLKHYLGTSKTAVWTQILVALIGYLLISMLKKQLNYSGSKTSIIRLIRIHLMEKAQLENIFKPPARKELEPINQLTLNLTGQ